MPAFLQAFSEATGSGLEWVVVFSFVAFAFVYFLAPVLGYAAESRGMVMMALYGLIAYGALVLLQTLIAYLIYLVSSDSGTGGPKALLHFGFIFGILKLAVFLASEGLFVLGLQKLKRP